MLAQRVSARALASSRSSPSLEPRVAAASAWLPSSSLELCYFRFEKVLGRPMTGPVVREVTMATPRSLPAFAHSAGACDCSSFGKATLLGTRKMRRRPGLRPVGFLSLLRKLWDPEVGMQQTRTLDCIFLNMHFFLVRWLQAATVLIYWRHESAEQQPARVARAFKTMPDSLHYDVVSRARNL